MQQNKKMDWPLASVVIATMITVATMAGNFLIPEKSHEEKPVEIHIKRHLVMEQKLTTHVKDSEKNFQRINERLDILLKEVIKR